jgi:pimeloyl-ACP methyl ester carboxylesterase
VDFILEDGYESLVPVVGTNYDLVAFDPRGLGRSIPAANCSAPSKSLRRRAFGMSGPELSSLYWDQTLESAHELGAECKKAIGGPDGAGPHMSTAVVATDMVSIVDAFAKTDQAKKVKNPSLVNYWGVSYGTFIGETFASMFPDRVGRVALDGMISVLKTGTVLV